jgi:hypothetical protein
VANEVMDTSDNFKSIIKEYINARYFQILRAINWQCIRKDYTFDTTASQQEYVLPDDFGKEIQVVDKTNGRELIKTDLQKLITDFPDAYEDSGSVERYYILEDTVQNQPTSASVLSIVSSSNSDTTQTILIRGIVDGVETTESVTLNGTTSVSTTNEFSRVKAISKSGNTNGYITISAGSITIGVLAPKILEGRYKKIGLHYVPTTSLTIGVPYIIKPLPLTEDYDYPIIDIADLIETGAKADAWRYKRQFAKANVFEVKFNSELAEYVWEKENDPNRVIQFMPVTFNKDNLY